MKIIYLFNYMWPRIKALRKIVKSSTLKMLRFEVEVIRRMCWLFSFEHFILMHYLVKNKLGYTVCKEMRLIIGETYHGQIKLVRFRKRWGWLFIY